MCKNNIIEDIFFITSLTGGFIFATTLCFKVVKKISNEISKSIDQKNKKEEQIINTLESIEKTLKNVLIQRRE